MELTVSFARQTGIMDDNYRRAGGRAGKGEGEGVFGFYSSLHPRFNTAVQHEHNFCLARTTCTAVEGLSSRTVSIASLTAFSSSHEYNESLTSCPNNQGKVIFHRKKKHV